MAIDRMEIRNFLVFKGEFTASFCPGINVLIGGNGTGKTTLMKCLYDLKPSYTRLRDSDNNMLLDSEGNALYEPDKPISGTVEREWGMAVIGDEISNYIYIPEKDILEHAKGLLPFIEKKQTGFGQIYKDTLINAQDIPTSNQSETQRKIGEIVAKSIGGYIEWVQSDGSFYTIRTDGKRIPFAVEASGYKKLGFLGLLVASGQLDHESVLFWDEPENSLNPELIPILVDILLELSSFGVQIFVATHSELLANYFSVNRSGGDIVMFTALYKDDVQIKANTSDRFDLLEPNNLTAEPVKLYEKEIEKGLA